MQKSLQRFPRTPSQYLRAIEGEVWRASDAGPGMFKHLQSFVPWLQIGMTRCQKRVAQCSMGRLPAWDSSLLVLGLCLSSAGGEGA